MFDSIFGGFSQQQSSSGGGTVISVSGTTNRITSTGGDTPVIDISPNYIGQNTITTLGTISTGEWNAGQITTTPAVRTSGSASYFVINTPADTTLTASTESIGLKFGGGASAATVIRQFSTGAITTQRENLFIAPTYAFVGASTITDAATLAISGAPIAGTNATITRSYGLWVQGGGIRNDGNIASRGVNVTIGPEDNNAIGIRTNNIIKLLISSTGQRTTTCSAVNNTWLIYNQTASTSGTTHGIVWTGAAHTGQTASTELNDINYNFARIVTFGTGALTTQRTVRIQAATYAFIGGSTITTAATLALSGAPIAGNNATITNSYALWVESGASLFSGTVTMVGFTDGSSAAAGNVGEVITSTVSTYTNYNTTATYQNITSIALTAGDWDITAFATFNSNSATITAANNAIFVISTTTASADGATEGLNIAYVPQAALLGTSLQSVNIANYRVTINSTTTYYLNTQSTFTLGNPQYVGTIRARRLR